MYIISFFKKVFSREKRRIMDLEAFIRLNIIEAAGLGSASEETKKEFLQKLSDLAISRVFERIEGGLSQEKSREFYRVFGQDGDPDQKDEFLRVHIPDFEKIIVEETLLAKKEIVDVATKTNVI